MNVELHCPKCGAQLQVPLAQMSPGNAMSCSGCGTLIRFSGEDAAKVQQAIVLSAVRIAATASLAALIVLCLAWELWLAPLRPGGSLIALKALPLAAPLGGIVTGHRRTYQWSSFLILAYFAEGATRAWSEVGLSRQLAWLEIVLSVLFFSAAVSYARATQARGHR